MISKEKIESFKLQAEEYLGQDTTTLAVMSALEQFFQVRNYPSNFTEAKKLSDIDKHFYTIVMGIVEIDARNGIEGQITHSENGISRMYSADFTPIAYKNIAPFVGTIL